MTHLENPELDDELVREFENLDDFLELMDGNLDTTEMFDAACRFFRAKYKHSVLDFENRPLKPMSKADLSLYLQGYQAENERMAVVAEFRIPFMNALAVHDIQSGPALLAKGSHWFTEAYFPPYGYGCAFGSAILGRTLDHVTRPVLREIIDKLGIRGDYKKIMQDAGIPDYNTLYRKGRRWFMSLDFPPVGKGETLANQVLNHGHKRINSDILRTMALAVGLPIIGPETISEYRRILADNGVHDKETLLQKGSRWFIGNYFEPYGFGHEFARVILSRHGRTSVNHKTLNEICDVLQLS